MARQWTYNSEASEQLKNLFGIISPSMEEMMMARYLHEQWSRFCCNVETDIMGNICTQLATEGPSNLINLGIVAHMDTVAIQITNVLSNGMLQFRHIGLMPHTLFGQPMKIITKSGIINGVIGFDPTSQYGQPKGLVLEDLWMDIGATGYEEACKMVEVGNIAVLCPRFEEMGNCLLCGTAIDDRVGLFIQLECMKWFASKGAPVNLHFMASVQEEIGLRGAYIAAANVDLDACIILDVDYATDTPVCHENQMGKLCLGKGVGLHVKADNNPVLRNIAKKVAEQQDIPYQLSVGRFTYGGTDSAPLQIQKAGIATINVSIPCRYMHSPVEICHKDDIESAVHLIIGLVNELGNRRTKTFRPGLDD